MSAVLPPQRALTGAAFATLLLIALMMGANHVAARIAFNNGADVATAVVFRSTGTALAIGAILVLQGVRVRLTPRHKRFLPVIGLLIGVQSLCLYSAVARLPVALALLAFNTYPICTAVWSALIYRHRPDKATLVAMPVILVGLALALDVFGAASGLGAAGQWSRIGAGVAFALAAAGTFALALVLTQHEAGDVDSRVRTASTMAIAAAVAFATVGLQGGFHLPTTPAGWGGLAALTFLYGTAFTIMFTVLPQLGVVGNSAIMNVEPVFALALGWLLLGQAIATDPGRRSARGGGGRGGAGDAQAVTDVSPPPPPAPAAPARTSARSPPCLLHAPLRRSAARRRSSARPHSVTSLPMPACGTGVRSTVTMSMLTRPTSRVRTPSTRTGVPVTQWRG